MFSSCSPFPPLNDSDQHDDYGNNQQDMNKKTIVYPVNNHSSHKMMSITVIVYDI